MRFQTTRYGFSGELLIVAVAFALGGTNALAGSLTLIPTLGADTVNEARAITPDGQYVVGLSGPAGTHGFFYSVSSGIAYNVISADNAQSTAVTGVGYRYVAGQQQIVMSGLTSSGYTDWMLTTPDGGSTFTSYNKRRDTNLGTSPWTIPAANGMAGTSSDVFYGVFRDNVNYLRVGKYSGAWAPTGVIDAKSVPTAQNSTMNGVSSTGRAIGYRNNASGAKQNYVMDWTGGGSGSVFFFNGLDGTTLGQAFSVSADGTTIYGQSPKVGDANNFGYKAVFSGQVQTSINPLPLFGDEVGSTSLQVPYGSGQLGQYAVGMDYRGTEKAVIWYTSDPNPANWSVTDLTQWASDRGLLDGFNRLSRAYTVGENAIGELVIAGVGSWSPDSGITPYTTRAWILVIPEPGTISLLALGLFGLVVLHRRK